MEAQFPRKRIRQSCNADFDHVDRPNGSSRILILCKQIHATCAQTIFAEKLGARLQKS